MIRTSARSSTLETLKQFQRASDIRSAFFPDGGPTPVQLTIAPHTISRDADMALLEVNQVVLRKTSLAGNAPVSLAWPGNGGSGTANISLYPELPGSQIAGSARKARGR